MPVQAAARLSGVRPHSGLKSRSRQADRTLRVGDRAPAFILLDADMEVFDLEAMRGKRNVVLYFYPHDNTPGCIRQAVDFSDHVDDFERYDGSVVGVSPDDCLTHAEFRDLHGLSVRLLSDEGVEICRRYGVWESRTVDGIVRTGVTRTSFIIDKQGVIRYIFRKVAPGGHVAEVLQALSKL